MKEQMNYKSFVYKNFCVFLLIKYFNASCEIKITYCDYKVYMLQFKYGCYHALKSFGSLSRSKNAGHS